MKTELWFTEYHRPGVGLSLKVTKTLCVEQSSFQEIQVLDTEEFGRVLLLDGLIMTTESDEFIYHEMIVHPAMFLHPSPKNVLVIGGGDGGAIREIVRHKVVEKAILCEIDQMVVDVSRNFLPDISCELEGNPRVEVMIQDGIKFIESAPSAFDVVIVDSTDPIGPASGLFKLKFYQSCYRALGDNGILVAQSESPYYHLDLQKQMRSALFKAGFSKVMFYTGPVPSYPSGWWSWVMATKGLDPIKDIDGLRFDRFDFSLKYYSPKIHKGAFMLPAFMEKALS